MNWTIPRRLHLMVHRDFAWVTVRIFGRRYHWSTANVVYTTL